MTDLVIAFIMFMVGMTAYFSFNAGSISGAKEILLDLERKGVITIVDKDKM